MALEEDSQSIAKRHAITEVRTALEELEIKVKHALGFGDMEVTFTFGTDKKTISVGATTTFEAELKASTKTEL